jgi:cytochrome o ubiquinol oxidase subunit 2
MKLRNRIAIGVLAAVGTVLLFKLLLAGHVVALFQPRGTVAEQERNVIVASVAIMLALAIPMLAIFYATAWKYRADNPHADRTKPDRPHHVWDEVVLWLIPAVGVVFLARVAWTSTHALDPFMPLPSATPALTVRVVALPWKWLFIYPEQGIATVNYVEFPEKTPVHFELTADGPMSSFWIPQLGSQIYAMSAMQTQLNLMADSTGDYVGKENEINGDGYAGMTFTAKSVSRADFDDWAAQVRGSSLALDRDSYAALAKPSEDEPQASYARVEPGLYEWVVTKDMRPPDAPAPARAMPEMHP